jgi:hypothetical protein
MVDGDADDACPRGRGAVPLVPRPVPRRERQIWSPWTAVDEDHRRAEPLDDWVIEVPRPTALRRVAFHVDDEWGFPGGQVFRHPLN